MGKGGISLGLESERFEDVFESDEVSSQRYLAKLTYGLAANIDVFAKIGTGALSVIPAGATPESQFTGDSRVAVGGGVRLESRRMPSLWGCRFFSTLQWLQFDSDGEFLRQETHKDYTWEERLETSYTWREIGAAVGLSRAFEKATVYGGLAFTHIGGQIHRNQYVLSENGALKVGEGTEDFTEGPGSGLFLGADFPLSSTLQFSTEYQLNDRKHGTLFFGISERMD
jgi:hypothetical protein